MWTQDVDDLLLDEGLCTIEAEFLTADLRIHASIISPETRLSDHLNSSTSMLELQPTRVEALASGKALEVSGHASYLNKAHLLAVIPIQEPDTQVPAADTLWVGTLSQTCWVALGPYTVEGKIHMDAGRNPRLILRSLEQRHFVPLTDARVTAPDGTVTNHPAILVNRHHFHLLVLDGP